MNFTLLDHEMDWTHLNRFLLIGHEGGLYIAPAPDFKALSTPCLDRCVRADGVRVVRLATFVLVSGCAYRMEPALLALARAIRLGDDAARREALDVLPIAVRSAPQLLTLLDYLPPSRRWDAALRHAVGAWYGRRSPVEVVTQVLQSPRQSALRHQAALAGTSRNGSGRPVPAAWFRHQPLEGMALDPTSTELLCAHRMIHTTDTEAVVAAVLQRWPALAESVPARWLSHPRICRMVLQALPAESLMRRLPAFTAAIAQDPDSETAARLFQALQLLGLSQAPFSALPALQALGAVRASRAGARAGALQSALYELFHDWLSATRPTLGTLVIAVDAAASDRPGELPGLPGLSAREVFGAVVLMATAAAREVYVLSTSRTLTPMPLARGEGLDAVLRELGAPADGGGHYPASASIKWALRRGVCADAFLVLNQSTFTAGAGSVEEMLHAYRAQTGIPTKWLGVSLGPDLMCQAPPSDLGTLEMAGLDFPGLSMLLELLREPG